MKTRTFQIGSCLVHILVIVSSGLASNVNATCRLQCPLQDRKQDKELDVGCGPDCKIEQCVRGCGLWEKALQSSCQAVCDGTQELIPPKELYCVMGCNDALNSYLHQVTEEMGTPVAPALVADSLTSTSLSLEWEGSRLNNISYLVQWKYAGMPDSWHYCRNQTWMSTSTVFINDLQPYTKYKFRIALVLSVGSVTEPIVSEASLVILTLASGLPRSKPHILTVTATDPTRVSVTWKPGLFPNGPILSYVLSIDELPFGYKAHKDIGASERKFFYMFQNLIPSRNYSVSVAMRNAEGMGPVATAFVSTPPTVQVKEDEKIVLILGGDDTVMSQPADMLVEPVLIYKSHFHIRGVSLDVRRRQLYVCESSGNVVVTSLDQISEPKLLLTESSLGFEPHFLSVDWLNQLLYILGRAPTGAWHISRCASHNGTSITVAVAGLPSKPIHIQVDPYNGYLFWVVQGARGGLYRLDLADISNGIKREVRPEAILEDADLGAFTVDHTNFRVLIASHTLNTVLSVSLDGGEVTDVRERTQAAQFQQVVGLAWAQGLFYWTDGERLLAEEYHQPTKAYFHNLLYPDSAFSSIALDLEATQPLPVPVNPPTNLQAIMGSDLAKASWNLPHLLAGQGRGAWQSWNYELSVENERDGKRRSVRGINSTSLRVSRLEPDTPYLLRVAAYTDAGRGPWSTPFHAKSLTSSKPKILWSTAEGLVMSEPTGETARTLIHLRSLKDIEGSQQITGITWYEDRLYLLTNTSSLYWYNLTSRAWGRLADVDSPGGSIAVDWLGRKIYWSSPKQQLITRGNLNGSQQEPLPILTVAKELNIDAIHGYIYWSTGHSVECSRLNGKQRFIYYNTEIFSGVQVMGLTLDMGSKSVLWIVRSYEGSTLFKATSANQLKRGEQVSPLKMSILQSPDMQGSLCYFDNHLLWLRDDRNAVIGDLSGQNSAVLTGVPLSGINVVQVLDNSLHSFPDDLKNRSVNVIPEAVSPNSLRVEGPHGQFNITWDPVTGVNYGQVFYELKLGRPNGKDITIETSDSSWRYRDGLGERRLSPYSRLSVSVRALTYWGTARRVTAHLNSPPAIPSPPLATRFYVSPRPSYQLFRNTASQNDVRVTFRWDPPKHPNGPILEYRLFFNGTTLSELSTSKILPSSPLEINYQHVPINSSFYFQVSACTAAGCGLSSELMEGDSGWIHPVPMLLLGSSNSLQVLDWDLGKSRDLARASSGPLTHISYSAREHQLFYFDDTDIMTSNINSNIKFKVVGLNRTGLSLSIDWVGRFLYWSEEGVVEGTSLLKRLDISLLDQGHVNITVLLQRPAHILSLQVDPLNGNLYWIELKLNKYTYVQRSNMDGNNLQPFFKKRHRSTRHICNCPESPVVGTMMTVDHTVSAESARIYWIDAPTGNIVASDQHACICNVVMDSALHGSHGLPASSIGVDESNIYWSNSSLGLIYSIPKNVDLVDRKVSAFNASGVQKIITYGQHLQPYPDMKCLIVGEQIDSVSMVERTSTSLSLEIPEPRIHDCSERSGRHPSASVKNTLYYGQLSNQGNSQCDPVVPTTCSSLVTYNSYVTVDGLSPYTRYVFYLVQSNFYMDESNITAKLAPSAIFQTSAGAPPPPEEVSGVVMNPTCLQISWLKPRLTNTHKVLYEVMWQSMGIHEGVRHSGEQSLEHNTTLVSPRISIQINKLLPSLTYKIWVRAYSESKDVYSESSTLELEMYPEPSNITLDKATSSQLYLSWHKPRQLSRSSYNVEYIGMGSGLLEDDLWTRLKEERFENGSSHYRLDNLVPKTAYTFRLAINYTNSSQNPYFWPPDTRFTFKTLGDRPSVPGMPVLQQLPGGIYQVTWEPSRDNGAAIILYWLEGKQASSRDAEDSTKKPLILDVSNTVETMPGNVTMINATITCLMFNNCSDEYITRRRRATNMTEVVIPDEWTLYYNGTETYWMLTEVSQYDKYKFRVRSKNRYGWSDYSQESGHFDFSTASLLVDGHQVTLLLWLLTPAAILLTIFIFMCVFYRHEKEKKSVHLMTMTNTIRIGNTDVELATLRELPRRRTFVQSTNVLYTSGDFVPCQADLAMLPHIRREQITLTKFLGSGAFGEVFEGNARNLPDVDTAETRVAVKTLRKGASDVEKGEFLKEAQLMSNFKHPHILELLGVCLDNDPNFIIMELMEGGDLLSYLRTNRPGRGSELRYGDLMCMCVDVARGCCYLEEMHFVHRDLACRNCLVSSCDPATRIVKIGDFGLARDIYKNDYYRKEGQGLLPVRWMAPESLVDGVFTCQSDVWSFGVLLWEILSLGQQPYPARNNLEVLHYVQQGGRLNRPNYANYLMYELMLKCWSFRAEERPTFKYCLQILEELKQNCTDSLLPGQGESWKEEDGKVSSDGEPAQYLELIYDRDEEESGYEIPRKVESPQQITTTEMEEVSSLDRLLPFVEQPLYYTNMSSVEQTSSDPLHSADNSDR